MVCGYRSEWEGYEDGVGPRAGGSRHVWWFIGFINWNEKHPLTLFW